MLCLGSVRMNYKYLSMLVAALAIYLLWMDVGLYLELQKFTPRTPGSLAGLNKSSPHAPYSFSPFCPMTVKLLLLPPSIQYVDEPLAYLTVHLSSIADYISPNAVSFIGVAVAACSARFMVHPDSHYRNLGVLLFKVRDYIDGLDGSIARERAHTHSVGHVANPDSWGWMVDGVCDGFGDIFRFIAFIFILHRALQNTKGGSGGSYTLLDMGLDKGTQSGCLENSRVRTCLHRVYRFLQSHSKAIFIVGLVGFQSLFSSILWNYFMINYHRVLETDQYWGDVNYRGVVETQAGILRSSSMWMVCYFWRLVNPQMITQIQLLAMLYNREVDLIVAVQFIGYLPPILVGLGSYLHLQLAEEAVRAAAFNL